MPRKSDQAATNSEFCWMQGPGTECGLSIGFDAFLLSFLTNRVLLFTVSLCLCPAGQNSGISNTLAKLCMAPLCTVDGATRDRTPPRLLAVMVDGASSTVPWDWLARTGDAVDSLPMKKTLASRPSRLAQYSQSLFISHPPEEQVWRFILEFSSYEA